MSRRSWLIGIIAVTLVPATSKAQTSLDSATYRKAQVLVNDGNIAAGRAIIDSMIARVTPGTNEYAEALYWRAVLSATAADAEMDYRRIIVDYSVSPRVEDVLLRLAQLELARADYDGALQHLNRLTLEHPTSTARARAGYWMARVLFEKNDIQRACAANADALARTSETDTELRNQISYLNQRCAGVAIATAPIGSAGDSSVKAKSDTTSLPVATNTSVSVSPPAPITTAAQKPPMPVPTTPRDAKPTMVDGAITDTGPPRKVAPSKAAAATPAAGESEYSVQVAAFNVKSQADAMMARLRKQGFESRVSGDSAPFRVRIGHYPTQAQANAVLRSLKAKQIDGFVVKAESR